MKWYQKWVASLRLPQYKGVMWGAITKRLHKSWGDWLRNVECGESSGRFLLTCTNAIFKMDSQQGPVIHHRNSARYPVIT